MSSKRGSPSKAPKPKKTAETGIAGNSSNQQKPAAASAAGGEGQLEIWSSYKFLLWTETQTQLRPKKKYSELPVTRPTVRIPRECLVFIYFFYCAGGKNSHLPYISYSMLQRNFGQESTINNNNTNRKYKIKNTKGLITYYR